MTISSFYLVVLLPIRADTSLSSDQERDVALRFNAGNLSAFELLDVIAHFNDSINILTRSNELSLIRIVVGHSKVAWMRCRSRSAVHDLLSLSDDGFWIHIIGAARNFEWNIQVVSLFSFFFSSSSFPFCSLWRTGVGGCVILFFFIHIHIPTFQQHPRVQNNLFTNIFPPLGVRLSELGSSITFLIFMGNFY